MTITKIRPALNAVIYQFIFENYGETEANDPAYDIKAMGKFIIENYIFEGENNDN